MILLPDADREGASGWGGSTNTASGIVAVVSVVRYADDSEDDDDGDGDKAIKKRSSLMCSALVETSGRVIDAFRAKAGVTTQEVIQSVMSPSPSAGGALPAPRQLRALVASGNFSVTLGIERTHLVKTLSKNMGEILRVALKRGIDSGVLAKLSSKFMLAYHSKA